MSLIQPTQPAAVLAAIDIAKLRHDVLIEAPVWKSRKRMILPNTAAEFRLFADYLHGLKHPVRVVFEATGNYHRPLAHLLQSEGFHLQLIASLEHYHSYCGARRYTQRGFSLRKSHTNNRWVHYTYCDNALAVARTREAMHHCWDKNDPNDAQVLLHLLKTGVTQHYHDPLAESDS